MIHGVEAAGDRSDHLDQRLTRRIEVTTADEAAIQLQKVGAHFHYVLETRIARTHVVDGHHSALGADKRHLLLDRDVICDRSCSVISMTTPARDED